jgi:hypothetical protein
VHTGALTGEEPAEGVEKSTGKNRKAKESADRESYKLYYVNFENDLIPYRGQRQQAAARKVAFRGRLFFCRSVARLDLGDFIIKVLLEDSGIGADYPAPIDEYSRRTANVEEIAIGDAGIDKLRGLG